MPRNSRDRAPAFPCMSAAAAAATAGDHGRKAHELPWLYLDSVGQEYGPIPGWTMREWLQLGRFPVGSELRVRLPEWERHLPLHQLYPDLSTAFVLPPAWPDMYMSSTPEGADREGRAAMSMMGRVSSMLPTGMPAPATSAAAAGMSQAALPVVGVITAASASAAASNSLSASALPAALRGMAMGSRVGTAPNGIAVSSFPADSGAAEWEKGAPVSMDRRSNQQGSSDEVGGRGVSSPTAREMASVARTPTRWPSRLVNAPMSAPPAGAPSGVALAEETMPPEPPQQPPYLPSSVAAPALPSNGLGPTAKRRDSPPPKAQSVLERLLQEEPPRQSPEEQLLPPPPPQPSQQQLRELLQQRQEGLARNGLRRELLSEPHKQQDGSAPWEEAANSPAQGVQGNTQTRSARGSPSKAAGVGGRGGAGASFATDARSASRSDMAYPATAASGRMAAHNGGGQVSQCVS